MQPTEPVRNWIRSVAQRTGTLEPMQRFARSWRAAGPAPPPRRRDVARALAPYAPEKLILVVDAKTPEADLQDLKQAFPQQEIQLISFELCAEPRSVLGHAVGSRNDFAPDAQTAVVVCTPGAEDLNSAAATCHRLGAEVPIVKLFEDVPSKRGRTDVGPDPWRTHVSAFNYWGVNHGVRDVLAFQARLSDASGQVVGAMAFTLPPQGVKVFEAQELIPEGMELGGLGSVEIEVSHPRMNIMPDRPFRFSSDFESENGFGAVHEITSYESKGGVDYTYMGRIGGGADLVASVRDRHLVAPDIESLSVRFLDGPRAGETLRPEPLPAAQWASPGRLSFAEQLGETLPEEPSWAGVVLRPRAKITEILWHQQYDAEGSFDLNHGGYSSAEYAGVKAAALRSDRVERLLANGIEPVMYPVPVAAEADGIDSLVSFASSGVPIETIRAYVYNRDGCLVAKLEDVASRQQDGGVLNISELAREAGVGAEGGMVSCCPVVTAYPSSPMLILHKRSSDDYAYTENQGATFNLDGYIQHLPGAYLSPKTIHGRTRILAPIRVAEDRCSRVMFMNAASNLAFETPARVQLMLYNGEGRALQHEFVLEPFASIDADVETLFPELGEHLASTGGAGWMMVESPDSALRGYQLSVRNDGRIALQHFFGA